MKINKRKSSKKFIIFSILIATLLVASVGVAYFIYGQNKDEVNRDSTSGVEEDQVKDSDDPNPSTNPDKTTPPGVKPSVDASIEAPTLTRAEQSGTNVRISAIFNSSASGTCSLSLEKGGARITRTADIIVGPSYYSCNGFLIPTSELSPGTWSVFMTHVYNDKTSNTTTGSVEIIK